MKTTPQNVPDWAIEEEGETPDWDTLTKEGLSSYTSGIQNFSKGVGMSLMDTLGGLGYVAAKSSDTLGLTDDWANDVSEGNKLIEDQYQASTPGSVAAGTGRVLGTLGQAFIPGQQALNVARGTTGVERAAKVGAIGAGTGALTTKTEDESIGQNAAIGAALGIGLDKAGNKLYDMYINRQSKKLSPKGVVDSLQSQEVQNTQKALDDVIGEIQGVPKAANVDSDAVVDDALTMATGGKPESIPSKLPPKTNVDVPTTSQKQQDIVTPTEPSFDVTTSDKEKLKQLNATPEGVAKATGLPEAPQTVLPKQVDDDQVKNLAEAKQRMQKVQDIEGKDGYISITSLGNRDVVRNILMQASKNDPDIAAYTIGHLDRETRKLERGLSTVKYSMDARNVIKDQIKTNAKLKQGLQDHLKQPGTRLDGSEAKKETIVAKEETEPRPEISPADKPPADESPAEKLPAEETPVKAYPRKVTDVTIQKKEAYKEAVKAEATKDWNDLVKATEHIKPSTRDNWDVVTQVGNDIRHKEFLADAFEHKVNTYVPHEKVRQRIYRSLENQFSHDRLLTDDERVKRVQDLDKILLNVDKNIQRAEAAGNDTKVQRLQQQQRGLESARDYFVKNSEEDAIKVANTIRVKLQDIGEEAKKAGVIDDLRDNYISHVLDYSKSKLTPQQTRDLLDSFREKQNKGLKKDFSIERMFDYSRELEAVVKGTGIKVETDVAKVVRAYEKSMQKAILVKNMLNHFESAQALTNTNQKLGFVTKDLQAADANGYVKFTGKDTEALKDYYVHPDLVSPMETLFRFKDPSKIEEGLHSISSLTKVLNTMASLFHATSLAQSHLVVSPKTFVKEAFSRGSGISAAKRMFVSGNKTMEKLVKNGLVIQQEDVHPTALAQMGVTIDNAIRRGTNLVSQKTIGSPVLSDLKGVQRVTDPIDRTLLQPLNKFTWDFMHASQKMYLGHKLFTNIATKNPDMDEDEIAKEVSSFINNSFGGLNWPALANDATNHFMKKAYEMVGTLKGRERANLALFAADWTISTIRASTQALPKNVLHPTDWQIKQGVEGLLNPKNRHDLARRYVISTAIMWGTLLNGINMLTSGKPIYENKDIARIDREDGTTQQLAKHSMEAVEWAHSPLKTLGNKLGFFPKAFSVVLTGRQVPWNPATTVKQDIDESALSARAKGVVSLSLPFQVNAGMQAPIGEKTSRAAWSFVGLPKYGYAKDSAVDSNIRRERQKQRQIRKREKELKAREEKYNS